MRQKNASYFQMPRAIKKEAFDPISWKYSMEGREN